MNEAPRVEAVVGREIDPPQRLLMGPGPVNAHPRVLRAMSAQLLGQFDPEFTDYMNDTMALYRQVFQTGARWTLMIDGAARAAIEAAMVSMLEPGDRVVIVSIGRFGALLTEIAERCGVEPVIVSAPWGQVAPTAQIIDAVKAVRPRLLACVHGDTSTTMVQPLEGLGEVCRAEGSYFFVDATATLGGMDAPVDAWGADIVSAGLQKCLGGPSGIAPITISERAAERIFSRRHVERGLAQPGSGQGKGARIASNYFDLAMILDYWSEKRLNHHTESGTLLYGARECARIVLEEGLAARFARHAAAGRAMTEGVQAMGLTVFGDPAHKMTNVTGIVIPEGVAGEAVRAQMRRDFGIEIGSAFGPLQGRIWRIGAMGYNATKPNVLTTLAALEAVLRGRGVAVKSGAAVDAALAAYGEAG
jgi:(S)-ureidoglycine-glyoxylate aminotransferase